MTKPDLLQRIETLYEKVARLGQKAQKPDQKERAFYAAKYLRALSDTVSRELPVFIVEPWHPLQDGLPLMDAGEMLLRLKDENGEPLPPYPAIMTFYHNGFTEEMDTILCLAALTQYRQGSDKQVSINISCRSLQNAGFVRAVTAKIESLKLAEDEKILLEIHESNAVMKVNEKTAALFRNLGVEFAIDDVGLSMNDVFRLSAFENIADYIKLDRQSVAAHPDDPRALPQILTLAHSFLPRAQMVAEGVQTAGHARDILRNHPGIKYVQGMHLPEREVFQQEWKLLRQ